MRVGWVNLQVSTRTCFVLCFLLQGSASKGNIQNTSGGERAASAATCLPSLSHGTQNAVDVAAELVQFHQNDCLAVGLGVVMVVMVVMVRRTQQGEDEHGGSADPDVGLWDPKPPHDYSHSALTAGLAPQRCPSRHCAAGMCCWLPSSRMSAQ